MSEENILRFGVYGKEALGMVNVLLFVRTPWWIDKSGICLSAEGEVIYDSAKTTYRSRTFSDEGEKKKLLRQLGTCIMKAVRYRILGNSRWQTIDSPAKLRNDKESSAPLKVEGCPNANMKQFALLIELFWGYKEHKNILKAYDKETIDAVIGKPADPFTSSAVQVLYGQLEELENSKKFAVQKFDNETRHKRDALCAEWDTKIKEMEDQIEAFRAATVA